MPSPQRHFSVIVPAAGVGKRMQADRPKQYLPIGDKCVLEHTLDTLISHPRIDHIVVVIDKDDPYFHRLPCSDAPWLSTANGGAERADSVLAGLRCITQDQWVLVHDAARPCVTHEDIDKLMEATQSGDGAILACAVKDTMKISAVNGDLTIETTIDRERLFRALTPQMFSAFALKEALTQALAQNVNITDEASAMEWRGQRVRLIMGNECNIKITHPADLKLAEFYLAQEKA